MISYRSKAEIDRSCSSYLTDESRLSGDADAVYFPESFDEVVRTIKQFHSERTSFTISSGRTGITGGAVPQSGALLSFERMNHIIGLEQNDDTLRVHVRLEPGVRLNQINSFLETYQFMDNKRYCFPVDPTETSACVGGMVSVNASGARSFRNGALRKHVAALTVVLPDGEVLMIRRGDHPLENGLFHFESVHGYVYKLAWSLSRMSDIKNSAGLFYCEGMDLIDFFIGAEGLLGVIAEAEIMLVEAKEEESPFMAFFPSENEAISCVDDLRQFEDVMSIEYFGPEAIDLLNEKKREDSTKGIPSIKDAYRTALLFEIGVGKEEMDSVLERIGVLLEKHGSSLDATWDGTDTKEAAKLKLFRHIVPEAINEKISEIKMKYPEIHKLGTDMAVPRKSFREMMLFYRSELKTVGLDSVIFGHIGDCHVHVNIIPKNLDEFETAKKIVMRFAGKAVELGGTVSAEHGIGKLKKDQLKLMYSEWDLQSMKKVKLFFDPEMLLNQGNMI